MSRGERKKGRKGEREKGRKGEGEKGRRGEGEKGRLGFSSLKGGYITESQITES
jgi:hypothetical protein